MSLTQRLCAAADTAATLGYHGTASLLRDLADAVADDGVGSHHALEEAICAEIGGLR